MKVIGISMVRNEADVVGLSVLHQLSLGLDEIVVVDNGSTDGTDRILAQLSRRKPIRWLRDNSIWEQDRVFTELTHEAYNKGADWILPFDADEFWVCPARPVKAVLANSDAAALRAQVVNFIQRRSQREGARRALLGMTRRTEAAKGPPEKCQELVESCEIAFVEMMYPPKHIVRANPSICLTVGNHEVLNIDGPVTDTDEIACLHAPLRSRAHLVARAEQGRRAETAGWPEEAGWHVRRWRRLEEEGRLGEEWRANSYEDDHIDVGGTRRRVAFDPSLRDAVAPFLDPPWGRFLRPWR